MNKILISLIIALFVSISLQNPPQGPSCNGTGQISGQIFGVTGCVCDQENHYVYDGYDGSCVLKKCDVKDQYPKSYNSSVPDSLVCGCGTRYISDGDQCLKCPDDAVANTNHTTCLCRPGFTTHQTANVLLCVASSNVAANAAAAKAVADLTIERCHPSCNCEPMTLASVCPSCYQCDTCKQPEYASSILTDYCQCDAPEFILEEGSDWKCVPNVNHGTIDPECKFQLFNTIKDMVVHSNCSFVKESDNISYIEDHLVYDWTHNDILTDICKAQLVAKIQISDDCDDTYVDLPTTYWTNGAETTGAKNLFTNIKIKLIDVYSLTNKETTTSNRYINQNLCLAIDLSNGTNTVRLHKFEIRVYTNRDQVKTFHLDVSKQITDGCDKGQQCVVIANLDTEGKVMTDNTFVTEKTWASTASNSYTVGDFMYVQISFKDSTYTQYLQVTGVTFVDDDGIYSYTYGTHYWYTQRPSIVYVKILLFQPQDNATVQIQMKIQLDPTYYAAASGDRLVIIPNPTRLRNLADTVGEYAGKEVTFNTKTTVLDNTVKQTASAQTETDKESFAVKLALSCLSVAALLFI